MNPAVAITGIGLLTAGGIGLEAAWQSVRAGRAPVTERLHQYGENRIAFPVYEVPPLELADYTTHRELELIEADGLAGDPDFTMLVVTARQALAAANLDPRKHRVGLVLAHENLGVVRLVDGLLMIGHQPILPPGGLSEALGMMGQTFYNLQSFPHLFYLARLLGLEGPCYTVNNACASGLYALDLAQRLLADDSAEAVLVLTSDYAHVTEYLWLQAQGFTSASGRIRPFDLTHDGAVLGDGAAGLLLESVSTARERDQRIMALYRGGYAIQEGWRMSLPDPTAQAYARTIKSLLERTALSPSEIDWVVPHGTGSPLFDRYEAMALASIFTGSSAPPVTGLKGYIGHTLGASALVETVLALQGMVEGWIPPTLGCKELDVRVAVPVTITPQSRPVRTLLKSVAAFGGFTAAALFQRPEPDGGGVS